MALNKTVPSSLADEARKVVSRISITAKLKGLEVLVEKLRMEQPDQWRMVIFTGRRYSAP
jgi:Ni,Fe-hydrogenase III component G